MGIGMDRVEIGLDGIGRNIYGASTEALYEGRKKCLEGERAPEVEVTKNNTVAVEIRKGTWLDHAQNFQKALTQGIFLELQ